MHTVKIASHQFYLPLHLGEVTPSAAKRLGGLILIRDEDALPHILYKIVPDETRKWLAKIDPAQLIEISKLLSWMVKDRVVAATDTVSPLVHDFYYNLRQYYLPENDLNDVTINEWMWVETAMRQLEDDKDTETALARLIAIVCRPLRPRDERMAQDFDGYPRIKFNPELIPALTEKMKKAPAWVGPVVIDYLMRCQKMLHARYGVIFEGTKSEGVNFGWKGAVMSLAEAGIYGREKDVLNENIHNVCLYLAKKTLDARAEQKRIEKMKREKR